MAIKGFEILLWFLIIPLAAGNLPVFETGKEKDWFVRMADALICGYVLLFAVFELLALPLIFTRQSFAVLKYSYEILVCVLALAAPFSGMESWASSGKISFSDPSAMVGNQVTVNVKVTATEGALGGADIMLAYDPSVLEFVSGTNANGGAGSIRLLGTMEHDLVQLHADI